MKTVRRKETLSSKKHDRKPSLELKNLFNSQIQRPPYPE